MTKLAAQSLLLALVLLASCKKSSNSSTPAGGTITATVDGTPMTFNNVLIAKETAYSGAYVLTFSGASSLSSSSSPELSLTVDGTSAITTGTYSIGPSGNTPNLPAMSYSQGTTLIYGSDVTGTYASSIVITSLSKTNVQGEFTGTLTLITGSGATTKAITDGKFNVNFK
jgi:hypothetical protein